MVNLNSITMEQISTGLDNAPSKLKDAISSEQFSKILSDIENRYSLLEELEQDILLEQIVVLFVAGLIKKEELPQAISDFVYVSAEESQEISNTIISFLETPERQIIAEVPLTAAKPAEPYKPITIKPIPVPSTPAINRPIITEPVRPTTPSTPTSIKIPVSETPKTESVSPAQAPEPPKTAPAPFIIHSHEEEKPKTIGSAQTPSWTYKPAFIKPEFDARYKNQTRPQPAKVETANTEKVVNYSAPKITIDQSPASKTSPPIPAPPKIDSSNVIDLKDLPK